MIQITGKLSEPAPKILLSKGSAAAKELCIAYESGVRKFKFKSSIYGHRDVKRKLIEIQKGKCCFCESEFLHVSYGDVEHYRPKGGWIQHDEPLNEPGYYWLAYEWSNLFLSCSICNQQFKKNSFPLSNPLSRVLSHSQDIAIEKPLLLNPAFDNPEDHIEFKEEYPFGKDDRGNLTIAISGIDRETIAVRRRDLLNKIKIIFKLAKNTPSTPDRNEAITFLKELEQNCLNGKAEYSAMLKSFFSKNPIGL